MKMKKILSLALAAAMTLSLAACGGGSTGGGAASGGAASGSAGGDASTPSNGGETIKIICGYAAGGTADAVGRKYAQVANKVQSKYNFIVENQIGGDGFAADTFFSEEDPSTKDLLVFGYGAAYRHDNGKEYGVEEVDWDRSKITPIGTIDDRTWIMYAAPGTTLADVLEKAKTEGIKMSGGNPLSDPHLEVGSLLAQIGGKVTPVPYDGGANQKKGLTDGEVDIFMGSTQLGVEEVAAGTMVPILAFGDGAFEGFTGTDGNPISVPSVAGEGKAPELPADIDFSGSILPGGGTIAAHTGADQAFIDEITQITKDVWADEEFSGWIATSLLNHLELYGADAQKFTDDGCAKAKAACGVLVAQ